MCKNKIKKTISSFIVYALINAHITSASACGFMPSLRYEAPSYIDPDLETNDYGPKVKGKILLQSYIPAAAEEEDNFRDDADEIYHQKLLEILGDKNADLSGLSSIKNQMFFYSPTSCQGNTTDTLMEVVKAAKAEGLAKSDLLTLIQLRHRILFLCGAAENLPSLLGSIDQWKATSSKARKYPDYLEAISYFYGLQQNEAAEKFNRLTRLTWFEKLKSKYFPKLYPLDKDWVRETSFYVMGRAYLAASQINWDGYSEDNIKDNIDQALLMKAQKAFADYQSLYPQGRYTNSARNMRRMILKLTGNDADIGPLIREDLNKTLSAGPFATQRPDIYGMIYEYRRYNSEPADIGKDDPVLVASQWVGRSDFTSSDLEGLNKAKVRFERYPSLFVFLRSFVLYKTNNFKAVIETTNNLHTDKNPVVQSSLLIRARAFEKLKNYGDAEKAYRALYEVAPQDEALLNIAFAKLHSGHKEEILADPDILQNKKVPFDFAQYAFTDNELNRILDQKKDAAFRQNIASELLRRYLMRQDYQSMREVYSKTEKTGSYEEIRQAVKDPEDAKSRLKIGKFLYDRLIDNVGPAQGNLDTWHDDWGYELVKYRCGTDCASAEQPLLTPYALFKAIVENAQQKKLKSETDAEALHYMILCFKGAETKTRCQGENAYGKNLPKNNSRIWFTRLHSVYPNSKWAEETPYYY